MQESIKRTEEKDKSVKELHFCSCDGRNEAATTVSQFEECYDRNTVATTVTRERPKSARHVHVTNVMRIILHLENAERGKHNRRSFQTP